MTKKLTTNKHNVSLVIANTTFRNEQMDGQDYRVAPVILLTEGVHNGSGGPMYYPQEELAKFPSAWNGAPVPVYHPYNENGEPVSCNSPEILEAQSIGQLFNVEYVAPNLQGEVWINISKARRVAPDILENLESDMEVSTGLQSEDFMMPGIWNEEEYLGVVQNIRPDHLALLPETTGACSFADGCGIRANAENEEEVSVVLKVHQEKKEIPEKVVMALQSFLDNEMSHEDLRYKLQRLADEMDNDFFIHYVAEVYDTYVILRVETASGQILIKKNFTVDAADNVILSGESTQVRKVVTYEPVNPGSTPQPIPGLQNTETGGNEMAKKKEVKGNGECCKEEITAMIANTASTYTEDDRKWLEEMPADQIKRLAENLPVVDADGDAGNATETAADAPDTDAGGEETVSVQASFDDLVANASPDVQDMVAEMQTTHNARKKALIDTITANERCTFTPEQLSDKKVVELESIAALAADPKDEDTTPPNYSANGTGMRANAHVEEPLTVSSYVDKKEDKNAA